MVTQHLVAALLAGAAWAHKQDGDLDAMVQSQPAALVNSVDDLLKFKLEVFFGVLFVAAIGTLFVGKG